MAVGAVMAAANTSHPGSGKTAHVLPLAAAQDAAADLGMGGDAPAPEIIPISRESDALAEAEKLRKGAAMAARQTQLHTDAAGPSYVKPAQGVFTSGFESRWGTFHYGVDIANQIGTPILAAAGGVVIEAGPASGFGLWVRIRLPDGTINVYGHVDTIIAKQGQLVKAGEQIATMGNRGFSTGPHLHFEVWNPAGRKINPLPWLQDRGIAL